MLKRDAFTAKKRLVMVWQSCFNVDFPKFFLAITNDIYTQQTIFASFNLHLIGHFEVSVCASNFFSQFLSTMCFVVNALMVVQLKFHFNHF